MELKSCPSACEPVSGFAFSFVKKNLNWVCGGRCPVPPATPGTGAGTAGTLGEACRMARRRLLGRELAWLFCRALARPRRPPPWESSRTATQATRPASRGPAGRSGEGLRAGPAGTWSRIRSAAGLPLPGPSQSALWGVPDVSAAHTTWRRPGAAPWPCSPATGSRTRTPAQQGVSPRLGRVVRALRSAECVPFLPILSPL